MSKYCFLISVFKYDVVYDQYRYEGGYQGLFEEKKIKCWVQVTAHWALGLKEVALCQRGVFGSTKTVLNVLIDDGYDQYRYEDRYQGLFE